MPANEAEHTKKLETSMAHEELRDMNRLGAIEMVLKINFIVNDYFPLSLA